MFRSWPRIRRQFGATAVAQLLASVLSPAGGLRGSLAHPRGLRASLGGTVGKPRCINGGLVGNDVGNLVGNVGGMLKILTTLW